MDQYLARYFPERSRREWKELLREGRLRLEGRVVRASDPAPEEPRFPGKSGAALDPELACPLPVPEFLDLQGRWTALVPAAGAGGTAGVHEAARFWTLRQGLVKPDPAEWRDRVIFEDPWLLALDKPAGMPSHPLSWDEPGLTMADIGMVFGAARDRQAMPDTFAGQAQIAGQVGAGAFAGQIREAGLVHRLDNDTSGLLLFCKLPEAWPGLHAQFRTSPGPDGGLPDRGLPSGPGAVKTYLALVQGKMALDQNITWQLAHHRDDPRIMTAPGSPFLDQPGRGQPRPARTGLKVLGRFGAGDGTCVSLVQAVIHQGQHHQIRAHCAACGFPLLGDTLYGGSPGPVIEGRMVHLDRHLLHAWKLEFMHPVDGRAMMLEAPLSPDMQEILGLLGWNPGA